MKLILAQILQLLGALLALYGLLLAISFVVVPGTGVGARLDAAQASSSLFLTEPKYVFMARSHLDTPVDKAILLGASNMLAGFRQAEVQARVPGLEVHNLSVGGSNIRQVGQIVDLVREVQTPEARRHNTFVFGLWYGLFADDKARWYTPDRHAGDTDIDIERYRYGFYHRTPTDPEPVLPPEHLTLGVLLIHPSLVLDRMARDLTRSLRSFIAAKPAAITDEQRNAAVISEAERRKYLAFWRDYTGAADTVGDEAFQLLDRQMDRILADGGRVVLIDMPIPPWHESGSALAVDYRRRIDALLVEWQTRPGVVVLKMNGSAKDDDFSDEVHPKPRVTPHWADRLAMALNGDTDSQTRSASTR